MTELNPLEAPRHPHKPRPWLPRGARRRHAARPAPRFSAALADGTAVNDQGEEHAR